MSVLNRPSSGYFQAFTQFSRRYLPEIVLMKIKLITSRSLRHDLGITEQFAARTERTSNRDDSETEFEFFSFSRRLLYHR